MKKKIFFNSSLPRSCSTLVSNIIGQRPDFYVTPTSPLLEYVFGARANYSTTPEVKAQNTETMEDAFLGFCREGVNGYFEAITDKQYCLDKSRGHGMMFPFWTNVFGEKPRLICMVRDLKAIVASLEKLHRETEEVATTGIINHAQMQNTTTFKRVNGYLNSQPLGLALERLNEIILKGWYKDICFVKAEALTANPKAQMERIYEYLNVPPFEHDFENIEQITVEDDDVYGLAPKSLHQIRKSVSPIPDDSLNILGKDISDWIDNNQALQWYHQAFGYTANYKYKGTVLK
jgi:sulfotransferase